MKDLERALTDIANIRIQMAAGTVFQGFGPAVMAVTGVLALLATILQLAWSNLFASSETMFLLTWVFVAFVAAILIGTEAIARSKRRHAGLADQMIMNAIEQFLPAGIAGATVGAVLFYFNPEAFWLLPGLWQIFVALGIFTAIRSLPGQISLVGAWYFLAGICVLIIAAKVQFLHPLMMGVPFSIGQILMAFLLHIAEEKSNAQ